MKAIHITILAIASVSFISCSDLLNKEPLSMISISGLTYSQQECQEYVNQFYSVLRGPFVSRDDGESYDLGTDNLLSVNYQNNKELIAGLLTVPATGGGWGTNEWGRIRTLNFFLDNYTSSKELANVEKYAGEARFFRAYLFFEQFLKRFGSVPWIEHTTYPNSEDLYAKPLSRTELADKILADLDWAIDKLPSFSVQSKGRISKEVAQLYKARVALFEGTWEKYQAGTPFAGTGDPNNYFKIARDAANAVISSNLFSLDNIGTGTKDGYFNLFNRTNYSSSKEVMLWKERNATLGIVTNWDQDAAPTGNGCGLTRRLVDSYLCTDGKPIALSSLYKGDDNYLTVAENRDPRLRQTLYMPGQVRIIMNGKDSIVVFTKPSIDLAETRKCSTGYELAKGSSPDYTQQIFNACALATIFFRYAEALLIYAEAKVELGEITQSDLDISINKIRDRAGMPHLAVGVGYTDPNGDFSASRGYTGVPVSNLLQEIRRERRVELAMEGFRYDDIKRWRAHHLLNSDKIQGAKTAQFTNLQWLKDYFMTHGAPSSISGGWDNFINNTVPNWSTTVAEGVNFWTDSEGYFEPYRNFIPSQHFAFDPGKNYLWPIPTQELVLNKNLVQNPGWK